MNLSKPVSINHIVPAALVLLLAFGVLVPQVSAQANVTGKWSTLSYTMPINPIHTALLANGKILVVAGSGNCPPAQQRVALQVRPTDPRMARERCCWTPSPEPLLSFQCLGTCSVMAWCYCRMDAH